MRRVEYGINQGASDSAETMQRWSVVLDGCWKRRNEEWWWWWSGCQMLGGLFGERQNAGVQHLVLPPTDYNQLHNNSALLKVFASPMAVSVFEQRSLRGRADQLPYSCHSRLT